jgi:gliding motility-associated-like protein
MFVRFLKYYFLLTASSFFTGMAMAQNDGLYNLTFGTAPNDALDVAGPPLSHGFTEYNYSSNVCPQPGQYTVLSGIGNTCYSDSWIPLLGDNTFPDDNGYMMVIDDIFYQNRKTIFRDSVRETCSDVHYRFSAAIINLEKPSGNRCVRFSAISLVVEDYLGNVIASTSTGDIQFAVYNMGYHFTTYDVDFMVPAGTTGVVLKLIDEPKAAPLDCHNALAIDDIQLKVIGPQVNIGFENTPAGYWVKSACFQDNKSFTMFGNVDATVVNPAVHWQQSTDDGITWTDVPGANGYSLTQTFSVPDTFLFRLRGSDSVHMNFPNCGVFSNLLKVEVDGFPVNHGVTNNSPICAGQELVFTVHGGASYLWSGPNGFYDNTQFAHIFHCALADSGRYYVQIFSAGGCRVTDSTNVVIKGIDIKLGNDTTICKGATVQLQASGGSSYEWSPAEGLSNAFVPNPNATPQQTTTYTLKVSNSTGCDNAGHITIKVRNAFAVEAKFASAEYICRSFDSAFFVNESQGKIVHWNWDFGNGRTDSVENPAMQYYSTGNDIGPYNIKLTVIDTAGCSDSFTRPLRIAENCYIAVPTAFTPNNDGLNDYLYPLNAYKATNLLFTVFNRAGQVVFQTKDWNIRWDGKIGGAEQATGVYIWTLGYNDAAHKRISLKGTTMLIR